MYITFRPNSKGSYQQLRSPFVNLIILQQLIQDEEAAGAHEDGDGGDSAEISKRRGQLTGLPRRHPAMVKASLSKKNRRDGEIKRPEQILKARREQDKKRHKNARKTKKGGRGRGKGKA